MMNETIIDKEIDPDELWALVQKKGVIKMKIVSDSMEPVILKGDIVSVTKYTGFEPNKIVVFFHDKKRICHYLVNQYPDKMYETSSLKKPFHFDSVIYEKQIIGEIGKHVTILDVFKAKLRFIIKKVSFTYDD